MSIWASLDFPEPIYSVGFGGHPTPVDVATTEEDPDHGGKAIRIWRDDCGREDCIDVSVADAVRLRDALDRAIRRLHPTGPPPPPDRV